MDDLTIDGVTAMYTCDGVAVINVCALLDQLYGPEWASDFTRDYEVTQADIQAWCAKKGSHYYSRGSEDFNTYDAVDEARAKGLKVVVVEDLS